MGRRRIGDIPQPNCPVGIAAGQQAAIRAERQREDGTYVGGMGLAERMRVRWIGGIPQPDRAVGIAAGQCVAGPAERHVLRLRGREITVEVNSVQRLTRLLDILRKVGADPVVTSEKRIDPAMDLAWEAGQRRPGRRRARGRRLGEVLAR